MHTLKVFVVAFALLAACVAIGGYRGSMRTGALAFIPLWLAGAALNMWIGVNRAGYTYAEEFPIFLTVFAIPAVMAAIFAWRVG